MQSRLGIGGVVLVLSTSLSVHTAAAGPKEDVGAAADKWATVFAENNPDTIMALYAMTVCCGARYHPRYDRILPL